MSAKSFREFLKEKAKEKDHVERRQRREEWVAAISRLIAQFLTWLQEADPEGVLEIFPVDLEKAEQGLGPYQVPGLTIRLSEAVVQVIPVARNVVGYVGTRGDHGVKAEGRIDMTDGARKYILYRTLADGEHWYVLDERYQPTPLDRERFVAVLQDLLS